MLNIDIKQAESCFLDIIRQTAKENEIITNEIEILQIDLLVAPTFCAGELSVGRQIK